MSKMRLEEQMKYSQQLEQTRDDLQHNYQKKLESMRTREAETSAKMLQKEKEVEQQFYHHRQRMLADLEELRRREGELRKEEEFSRMRMAKSESRCKELEHALELKLVEVEKKRVEEERRRDEDFARERSELKKKAEEEEKRLREGRKELDEQKLQLKMAEDAFGSAMNEARLAREECLVLQAENESLTKKLEKSQRELQELQDFNVELREQVKQREGECERLQERMAELREEQERRGERSRTTSQSYEAIGSQLEEMRSSFSRERLLKEKQTLQLENQLKSARSEIISLQHQLSSLQRDNDELSRCMREKEEELMEGRRELGESRVRMKVMEEEVNDCKKLLWQTQAALDRDRQRVSDAAAVETMFGSSHSRLLSSTPEPSNGSSLPLRTRREERVQHEESQSTESGRKEDAWEFDMKRILSVINDLDHENDMLRKNRERYLAERRREKMLRSFEVPYAAALLLSSLSRQAASSQPGRGWTETSRRKEVKGEEEEAKGATHKVSSLVTN